MTSTADRKGTRAEPSGAGGSSETFSRGRGQSTRFKFLTPPRTGCEALGKSLSFFELRLLHL